MFVGFESFIHTLPARVKLVVAITACTHLCRFNCRAKGIGWRLDYFLASKDLAPKVYDTFMLPDVVRCCLVSMDAAVVNFIC